MGKYYHHLTIWKDTAQVSKVIGSEAISLDGACRERCDIAKRYHRDQIVQLTTHNTQKEDE